MPEINLISLAEYAQRIGRDPSSVRQKALRGNLPGAVKIGRNWLVPADMPYPDNRITSGKYVAQRDKR